MNEKNNFSLAPKLASAIEKAEPGTKLVLSGIVEQKPGVLDELASERIQRLETESAELQQQAAALADEINELSGQTTIEL